MNTQIPLPNQYVSLFLFQNINIIPLSIPNTILILSGKRTTLKYFATGNIDSMTEPCYRAHNQRNDRLDVQ